MRRPSDDEIEQLAADAEEGAWGLACGRCASAVRERDLKRGVEVGVAFGGHAESMLRDAEIEHLWSVDPYRHQVAYDDPMNVDQERFDRIYEFTSSRLAKFGTRVTLLRQTSEEAVSLVPNDIDFVYIDAIHTCEAVWRDIWRWARKVRQGGIIGGHDYGHSDFPGVKVAVDAFSKRVGWPVHELGETVWWMPRGGELPRHRGIHPRWAERRRRWLKM
jgi:hypothetical protein